MMIPAHSLAGIACMHIGILLTQRKDGVQRWENMPTWGWLVTGIILAYMSHSVIDALAIFTYHDSKPTGTLFSMLVFWGWLVGGVAIIVWALRDDLRYGAGILASLAYDLWDHWLLRAVDCTMDGFPEGCMSVYTHRFANLQMHHFEWFILDAVFDGVERHYGDEVFVLVELVFVGLLGSAIIWLRRNHPIPKHTEMTTAE